MIKNGTVAAMDYIRFGHGEKTLVILPGLGDGLRTVKGTALPMSVLYRAFGREYTVYSFSRRSDSRSGATTRDMAADVKGAMEALGIESADLMGVSMGGMISQWLAIDYPQVVRKLVLVVTSHRPNAILQETVGEWMDFARRGDHTSLMESNLRLIYTPEYYRKNRWTIPLIGCITKPKSYDRFLALAEACLSHDAADHLHRIQSPALVIGGEKDLSLGGEPSRQIAGSIPGAKLRMYEEFGHGLYEEAKDFQNIVLEFLTQKNG